MTTAVDRQRELDAQYDALMARVRGKVCASCDTYPRVAAPRRTLVDGVWQPSQWYIRCDCYPKPPVLASEYERTVGRRQWDMTTKALARLDEHGIKSVNAELMTQEVRSLLPSAQKATANEVQLFVRFCQSLGANPFIGEVYLIKYDERQPAAIVVGLAWNLKQAAKNPAYQGYKAGLIVQGEGSPDYREGAFALPSEKVVGAWCEVHRQGWTVVPKHAVSMAEYNNGRALWGSKPNTMILKVAINQAIRRAFPEEASETERSIVASNMRVVDEGQAGVDLEDARSSLSDDAAPITERAEAQTPAAPPPAPPTPQPKRPTQPSATDASNEFWVKQRAQFPTLDSFAVLGILGVKTFPEWKGTVDEALAKLEAKAKQAGG